LVRKRVSLPVGKEDLQNCELEILNTMGKKKWSGDKKKKWACTKRGLFKWETTNTKVQYEIGERGGGDSVNAIKEKSSNTRNTMSPKIKEKKSRNTRQIPQSKERRSRRCKTLVYNQKARHSS